MLTLLASTLQYDRLILPLINHPYCFFFQGIFIALATWYIIHRKSRIETTVKLTKQEEEELIQEWQPEELTPPVDPFHHSLRPRQVSSMYGKFITVNGKKCLNLATHNYLGFVENKECLDAAVAAVKKYGVGSCGPRGFFGTVDVHLELEMEIAKFVQTEEAILYSYGYSAISSAIPAYAKVGDIIFADEGVNFSIQQGLIASRSKIRWFKHNDIEDLAHLLEEQAAEDEKNPKIAKTRSRFIIVEGLYINYGDICKLPQIVELKHKYKVRLFIDDSCGFGVLGDHGRGVVEYHNLDIAMDIDMIAVSLEYATAAYGGFCAGTHYIIDHQRLSGLGYCFSASLPPLQAAVGLQAIKLIQNDPKLHEKLIENSIKMTESAMPPSPSNIESPIKHIRFTEPIEKALAERKAPSEEVKQKNIEFYGYKERTPYEYDTYRLEKVVDYLYEKGYALTVARYLEHMEHKTPEPSIRLTVSVLLSAEEIAQAGKAIHEAFEVVGQQFLAGEI